MGERTKKVLQILAEEIKQIAPEQDGEKLAKKAMEYAGLSLSKKNGNDLDALFFLSHFQAKALANLIVEGSSDKTAYHDALDKAPSIDMALFGRMVASDPSLNYDASAQVAHSISTHRVQTNTTISPLWTTAPRRTALAPGTWALWNTIPPPCTAMPQ